MPKDLLKTVSRAILPLPARHWIETQVRRLSCRPPLGRIDFGDLRRLEPISKKFGLDRGVSIDRYYMEKFLAEYSTDIRGDVLEIGDDRYTKKFGGNKVIHSEVLHLERDHSDATLVADLNVRASVELNQFDCIICTQTLHFIYDFTAGLQNLSRALRPGGILLATVAGISQISRFDMDRWGDYWRFTTRSTRRLFEEFFAADNIHIRAYGNVLSSVAFLHGIAAEELTQQELDYQDPDYQLLIAVRGLKLVTRP